MNRWMAVLSLGMLTLACKKEEPKLTVTPEAAEIFTSRCSTCHGTDGTGNGPAAAALNPKPRNYTDAQWQSTVSDDDLRKVIVKGGAAVGKSALMPPNPDLESKPEVVNGLVAKIRSFKK
jgi:mono/diheme cytochrome c family protein